MDELKAGNQDTFVDALLGYGTDLTARVECVQPNGITHTWNNCLRHSPGLGLEGDIGAVIDDETNPILDIVRLELPRSHPEGFRIHALVGS